jgi:hypothetical protein
MWRVLLLTLFIWCVAAAGDEPPPKDCTDGTWSCSLGHRTAYLVLAAFIVVCGIIFDFCKEKLEEHVKKASKPILFAFFGELMVGGFLSLLSFILVFSKALTGVSESKCFASCFSFYLTDLLELFDDKEFLPEGLEDIHVVLFLVFGVFMIQILYMLVSVAFTSNSDCLYSFCLV